MSRSQIKCLLASALGHLALAAAVVLGVAFVSKQKPPEAALPLLEMVPTRLIEEALSGGGGNPEVTEKASVPAQAAPEPAPVPPQPVEAEPVKQEELPPLSKPPEPEPPAPRVVDKPDKVEKPPKVEKPNVKKPTPKPPIDDPKPQVKIDPEARKKPAPVKAPKETSKDTKAQTPPKPEKPRTKPVIDVDLTAQKPKRDEAAITAARERAEAKAEADAKARRDHERRVAAANDKARADAAARSSAVANILQGIKGGLSQSTKIEMPGPGGEAYANYGQVIRSLYEQAWRPPSEMEDDSSTVEVEVTLSREGRVISSSILTKSGYSSLNKSVQDALNRVRQVPPFPEGAKDSQRTFRIRYNLRSKRQIG